MIVRSAAGALCLVLAAGVAEAEGWTIKDLGSVPTEAGCVDLAWDTIARYRGARSLGDLQRTEWVVYAYDLSNDDYDAIITCAYGPNDMTRATLVVYSAGSSSSDQRIEIADRIESYWEQMK